MSEEEAPLCRYCFDEACDELGDLVSPCACIGGQKHVHLECLRRWQRSVLVTQPTHPAFHKRDERQFKCNVCATEFSIPPPSRAELMAGFTGPELAALLSVGVFLVCEERNSMEMISVLMHNSHIPSLRSLMHWIKSCVLITQIEDGDGTDGSDSIIGVVLTRPLPPEDLPNDLRETCTRALGSFALVKPVHFIGGPCLQENATALCRLLKVTEEEVARQEGVWTIGMQGGIFIAGSLRGVGALAQLDAERRRASPDPHLPLHCYPSEEVEDAPVIDDDALDRPPTPMEGEDIKVAPEMKAEEAEEEEEAEEAEGTAAGGDANDALDRPPTPMEETAVGTTGEEEEGAAPCELAQGVEVTITGLVARPALNGQHGRIIGPLNGRGRWPVVVSGEAGGEYAVKPENLTGTTSEQGRNPTENDVFTEVRCHWGDARWSRAQLLGEIAKKGWGVCRAEMQDVCPPGLAENPDMAAALWRRLIDSGRPIYAPRNAMMEDD